MRTVAADKLNSPADESAKPNRSLSLQKLGFVFFCQSDDMLAQDDQLDGALLQPIEHLQSPLLAEVRLQRPHDLVVVIADGLELPIELCQPDVVVERRFVYFHDLDFALEKHGLDKLRITIQPQLLEHLSEPEVLVAGKFYTVAMYGRVLFGLAATRIVSIFLWFHPTFLINPCFASWAPTLEEDASAPAGSGEVSGGRKSSGPPETQLAVNACSRNFRRYYVEKLSSSPCSVE